jgi:hypothetical protein
LPAPLGETMRCMRRLDDLPGYPWTRFTERRLRSRACAAGDLVVAAVAAAMWIVLAVDDVASWPADRVLVTQHRLTRPFDLAIMMGCGVWLIGSQWMIFGAPVRGASGPWLSLWRGRTIRIATGVVALATVVVVAGGFAAGAASGTARVEPGSGHEVAARGYHDGAWTPVSAGEYRVWQARFVRMSAGAMIFLGAATLVGAGLFSLYRAAARERTG